MATYQNVSIVNALSILQNPASIVVDIRDEQSYRNGHLPNAVRMDAKLLQQIRKQKPAHAIIVYCYHGVSSKDIAQMLSDFGCVEVYSLEGGYSAWQSSAR